MQKPFLGTSAAPVPAPVIVGPPLAPHPCVQYHPLPTKTEMEQGTTEVSPELSVMMYWMRQYHNHGLTGLLECEGEWYVDMEYHDAPIDMNKVMDKEPLEEHEPLPEDFLAEFAGLSVSTDMGN